AVCPDAERVKTARKAAAKNLEFIQHLELTGGSTLNRFGAECKRNQFWDSQGRFHRPAPLQFAHASQVRFVLSHGFGPRFLSRVASRCPKFVAFDVRSRSHRGSR